MSLVSSQRYRISISTLMQFSKVKSSIDNAIMCPGMLSRHGLQELIQKRRKAIASLVPLVAQGSLPFSSCPNDRIPSKGYPTPTKVFFLVR